MVPSQVTSEAQSLHLDDLRRERARVARDRRGRRAAARRRSPLRALEDLVLARRRTARRAASNAGPGAVLERGLGG